MFEEDLKVLSVKFLKNFGFHRSKTAATVKSAPNSLSMQLSGGHDSASTMDSSSCPSSTATMFQPDLEDSQSPSTPASGKHHSWHSSSPSSLTGSPVTWISRPLSLSTRSTMGSNRSTHMDSPTTPETSADSCNCCDPPSELKEMQDSPVSVRDETDDGSDGLDSPYSNQSFGSWSLSRFACPQTPFPSQLSLREDEDSSEESGHDHFDDDDDKQSLLSCSTCTSTSSYGEVLYADRRTIMKDAFPDFICTPEANMSWINQDWLTFEDEPKPDEQRYGHPSPSPRSSVQRLDHIGPTDLELEPEELCIDERFQYLFRKDFVIQEMYEMERMLTVMELPRIQETAFLPFCLDHGTYRDGLSG